MAALLGACSASHSAAPSTSTSRPIGVTKQPVTPPPPTTARPTTTAPPTTAPPPPLPAPASIPALVSPPLPGEGHWQSAGDRLRRGYAIYITQLRPGAGYPAAGIAWIDTAATRTALYAGFGQPYGAWPQEGSVGAAQQPTLMAAFNSGFKIYNYQTGWYENGRTAEPLQVGQASLVIFKNGGATVADWGRDVGPGPNVAAVRQNLTLLVDHGAPTAQAADPGSWGAVLGGGVNTWRSGVGVTSAGDLVYAAGPGLDPESLARVLVAAGAVRAMELDINPEWVSFSTFDHTGGIGGTSISGGNILPGMYYSPGHYLQGYTRDFFAVFSR